MADSGSKMENREPKIEGDARERGVPRRPCCSRSSILGPRSCVRALLPGGSGHGFCLVGGWPDRRERPGRHRAGSLAAAADSSSRARSRRPRACRTTSSLSWLDQTRAGLVAVGSDARLHPALRLFQTPAWRPGTALQFSRSPQGPGLAGRGPGPRRHPAEARTRVAAQPSGTDQVSLFHAGAQDHGLCRRELRGVRGEPAVGGSVRGLGDPGQCAALCLGQPGRAELQGVRASLARGQHA